MLVGDSRGKAEPRAPPQQPETETQPAEIFSATQEVPPTSPTPQRKHPSRCQLRKKRRMEQQGTEATQTQPTSEVDSPPANVPALPTTKTLPPRRWERADLRTGTASCSPPGSPTATPASSVPVDLASDQRVTTQAVTYVGSLFVPGRVAGNSLSFLVDTDCTRNLLSRTVFDRLPAQTRQQMVYGETVAAMANGSGLHTYTGAPA